jgi:hypothetical protein
VDEGEVFEAHGDPPPFPVRERETLLGAGWVRCRQDAGAPSEGVLDAL